MDTDRFDRLSRAVHSRRGIVRGLLAAGPAALLGVAAPDQVGAKKRCGRGKKKCGQRCIGKSRCCTNANCGAFKICAGGRCVLGQGTCTAARNYCIRSEVFDCGAVANDCACFITTTDQSRCGRRDFLPERVECLNNVDCRNKLPNVPGAFCVKDQSGANCGPGSFCQAPCPG